MMTLINFANLFRVYSLVRNACLSIFAIFLWESTLITHNLNKSLNMASKINIRKSQERSY